MYIYSQSHAAKLSYICNFMNYYGKKNLVMRTKPELHCQATDGHINPFGPVDLGPHATCVAGRAGNLNIV